MKYLDINRPPVFVKVFQPHSSTQFLLIPPEFKDRINGELPNRIFLKHGVGSWLVEVQKIGSNFYFREGWSKFVMENSLNFGEFMVFKYNGQRIFDVVILGINGCDKRLGADSSEKKQDMEEHEDVVKDEDENRDGDGDSHVEMEDNVKFGKVLRKTARINARRKTFGT